MKAVREAGGLTWNRLAWALENCIDLNAVTGHADPDKHIEHWSGEYYVDTEELALFIPDTQTDNTFTAEVDGSVLTYRITAPQTGEGPGSYCLHWRR
jgi:hypothetical protein